MQQVLRDIILLCTFWTNLRPAFRYSAERIEFTLHCLFEEQAWALQNSQLITDCMWGLLEKSSFDCGGALPVQVARFGSNGRHDACHVTARFTRVPGVHSQDVQYVPEIEPHRLHRQQHLDRTNWVGLQSCQLMSEQT